MKSFDVYAKRWVSDQPSGHGWELEVFGLGVTQCEELTESVAMVTDFIEIHAEVPASEQHLIFHYWSGDDQIDADISRLNDITSQLQLIESQKRRLTWNLVRHLINQKIPTNEIALLLGMDKETILKMSHQVQYRGA